MAPQQHHPWCRTAARDAPRVMPEDVVTDVLILGGGSAGCVLAARLTEDPARKVTLVEAGEDLRAGAIPPDIASSYPGRAFLNPAHTWPGLTAFMGAASGNAAHVRVPRRYEQAR